MLDAQVEMVFFALGRPPSVPQQLLAYREVLRGDVCSYCERRAAVCDHIVPRAISGGDEWENLTAACSRCNAAKSTRTLLAFLAGEPIGMDHRERERRRLQAWREGASM